MNIFTLAEVKEQGKGGRGKVERKGRGGQKEGGTRLEGGTKGIKQNSQFLPAAGVGGSKTDGKWTRSLSKGLGKRNGCNQACGSSLLSLFYFLPN